MTLRTRHIACLFLLFSTLGAAQANASSFPRGFHGDRISALLYRHAVDAHNEYLAQIPVANTADPETLLIPAPALAAVFHTTWTMRPPAAHSAAIFAATGFSRGAAL